jgi:hypothetical protein
VLQKNKFKFMQGNDAPRPRQHNRYDFLYNVQDVAPYRPDDAVINMIIYIYIYIYIHRLYSAYAEISRGFSTGHWSSCMAR